MGWGLGPGCAPPLWLGLAPVPGGIRLPFPSCPQIIPSWLPVSLGTGRRPPPQPSLRDCQLSPVLVVIAGRLHVDALVLQCPHSIPDTWLCPLRLVWLPTEEQAKLAPVPLYQSPVDGTQTCGPQELAACPQTARRGLGLAKVP